MSWAAFLVGIEVNVADIVRGITDSITFAHGQLKRARQDGGCEQIQFWAHRLDQLLDELSARTAQQPEVKTRLMNRAVADLIAERLPAGLMHPGDEAINQPAKLIPLPGLTNLGMPPEQSEEFAREAGLPANDAPKLIAEAIVHMLETEGFEIIKHAELEQMRAQLAAPTEVNPAAPTVEVMCQHFRKTLFQIAVGRRQVLMDCDAIKARIDAVHSEA